MQKIALAVVGLALVLAGCGGGETQTGVKAEGSVAAKPPAATGGGKYCDLARAYQDKTSEFQAAFANVDPTSTESLKDAFRKLVPEFRAALDAALAVAPGEIKTDLKLVGDAFIKYVDVLEAADYDLQKVAADPESLTALTSPEVVEATKRLTKYGEDVCGIPATGITD